MVALFRDMSAANLKERAGEQQINSWWRRTFSCVSAWKILGVSVVSLDGSHPSWSYSFDQVA